MTAIQSTPATKQTDPYLKAFERFEQAGASRQPSWLFQLRKAGIARFAELGFPTLKHEDWRFTNVAPIAKLPFKPVFETKIDGLTTDSLVQFPFAKLPGTRLVFVNGHYAAELSTTPAQPDGIKASNLAAALTSDSALIEKHLGRYVRTEDNAFAALNNAFFQDGGFIYVPARQAITEPVQFLFINTGKEAGATTHPRNLDIVEPGEDLLVHRGDALGGPLETVALRLLTDRLEDLADGALDARAIDAHDGSEPRYSCTADRLR
jgi:Fe-S cluster assembly protein SufD